MEWIDKYLRVRKSCNNNIIYEGDSDEEVVTNVDKPKPNFYKINNKRRRIV